MRIFACLFCLLIAACSSGAKGSAAGQVKLSHFRGPIYISEDSFYEGENSVVYVGEEYVTVVGATWTPETARRLVGEVQKITDKPIKEVVNTNWHHDRAGGNAFFKGLGAHIYATQKTVQAMKLGWDGMTKIKRKDWPGFPDLPVTLPDRIQEGDFTLQNGHIKAFYLGPSHTEDGIFVYFPFDKALYGGCILKERLGYLGSSNLTEYPKTLQKLKDLHLDFDTIISGHWSPLHGPELIDRYLALLAKNAAKNSVQ